MGSKVTKESRGAEGTGKWILGLRRMVSKRFMVLVG